MNILTNDKRTQIVSMLVEGNSIRAITRMTGVSKNTVAKLLIELGDVCIAYMDKTLRNLTCQRIQVDEIWSFVGAKDKNLPLEELGQFGRGSVWTWVAMDADTKLVPAWLVADRSAESASLLMHDLAARLTNRVQLTTDGHAAYLTAIESAFGADIDYSMLIKLYGNPQDTETRYSPGECIGCRRERVTGDPDLAHISTSFVERQNLTMRMSMRRFTRLTNAFSKKLENHVAMIAVHYMNYNFARIHQSLRITPAMAAGVSSHAWEVSEIVGLLPEPKIGSRGPYTKKPAK
jgi:IS1 family transposase